MPVRRFFPLVGLAAALALSISVPAQAKSLHEYFFAPKADATEPVTPGKPVKKLKQKDAKAKKTAAAAAKPAQKPAGKLPGVNMTVRNQGDDSQAQVQDVSAVVGSGNNGELRSDMKPKRVGFFAALFGQKPAAPQMLPQTRALDSVLEQKQSRKAFKVKAEFMPQEVEFSGYPTGTIVIDTRTRFLYLVESSSTARRYAIAVGREGLLFTGKATVGDKQEWPRWIPTLDMQKREPKHYGQFKDGMPGGPSNPLGARAIYLFQGRHDTHIRIHGTNQPQSIGRAASNGCFRMVNDHVIDLYNRVRMGTPVVVL